MWKFHFTARLLVFLGNFLFLNFATTAELQAEKPSAESGPVQIRFGYFLKKMVPNYKEGTFYAEFYWWVNFKNDSSQTGLSNDEIMNLEYVNGSESSISAFSEEQQEELRQIDLNTFYSSGYHQGHFFFEPDFTLYPFDRQRLSISVENTLLLKDQVELVSDSLAYIKSGNDPQFHGLSNDILSNTSVIFHLERSEIASGIGVYNSNFGDPDFPAVSEYSRLTLSLYIGRRVSPYITKLFIPLAIILFLVYFVFFIPPDKLDMAAALTVTSLLSAIAFQLSVNGDLPEIGYIIYVDKIFYSCYFLIAIAMAESLLTFYLDASGNEKKQKLAKRIDLLSRFLFPVFFLLSIVLFAM